MKTQTIEIVDHGRGPQLSTCRITVLDLVPYFQARQSYDEITRWIPTLSHEEIAVAERYYREHQDDLDDRDRRASATRAEQIKQQREKFPERNETPEEAKKRLKELLDKRRQEKDGEGNPG